MSLTRDEWVDMWNRLERIERLAFKVWEAKHYKLANDINWEVQRMKEQVQKVIGQME